MASPSDSPLSRQLPDAIGVEAWFTRDDGQALVAGLREAVRTPGGLGNEELAQLKRQQEQLEEKQDSSDSSTRENNMGKGALNRSEMRSLLQVEKYDEGIHM